MSHGYGYQQMGGGHATQYPPYANMNTHQGSFDSLPGRNPFADSQAALNNHQQQQQYSNGYGNGYSSSPQPQYPSRGSSRAAATSAMASQSLPYSGNNDTSYPAAASASKEGLYAATSPTARQNNAQRSAWMEGGQEPAKTKAWKKWAIIVGVPLLIIAGVAGGITAWKLNANSSGNSNSSSSSSSKSGSGNTGTSVSGDPSKFSLDKRLKKSFYALAYSPTGSILPDCGATLAQVEKDMQLLSQLTSRIRTYGSDCDASLLVMQAIENTKIDMTVWLGIYIDTDDSIWQRQRNATLSIIQQFGVDHISGITVGNEFLLNTDGAASSYTSIRNKVAQFKQDLEGLNLSKTIPVGTADAGSMVTAALTRNVDYYMANVHPWFGGVPIDQAAGWTWEWQQTNVIAVAGNTPAYIAETGWPSQSMTPANATLGGAVAGVPQLQEFLDTYICQANANQSAYFYFEPFDEPWKQIYGGVEPYWGLFDKDRNLKDITIPDCPPGNY